MASSSLPSAKNRSISSSARLTSNRDPQIEILYNIPAVIISFSTTSSASRPSSSNGFAKQEVEVGSFQWSSPVERTIAVGTLRIYRAPESVAFFNCQQALKPILPRSQCWFVSDDGSSKFVLQIRKLQEYWRIEIKNNTPEEIKQVEEFKEVLAQVLLFEKTPCPFQRNFTVELPDAPHTPIRRKPWRPVQRSSSGIPLPRRDYYPIASRSATSTGSPCTEPHSSSPLQLPVLHDDSLELRSSPIEGRFADVEMHEDNAISSIELSQSLTLHSPAHVVEDDFSMEDKHLVQDKSADPHTEENSHSLSSLMIDVSKLEMDEQEEHGDATGDTNVTPRNPIFLPQRSPAQLNPPPTALHKYSRSVTAPPILSLLTSPPSKNRDKPSKNSPLADPESEFSSSVESFHSIQSWHSPLGPPSPPLSSPPSPTTFPYPHNNIVLPKQAHTTSATSQLHISPESPGGWQASSTSQYGTSSRSISPPPRTPTLSNDSEKSDDEPFELTTPSPPRLRHRTTSSSISRRRNLSPLPPAVNLFSPTRRSRHLQTARHLPTAIIQKTCEILLSPPSHLFHVMMNIASKIAAGEWRGILLGEGEAVHWDFTGDEYYGEGWAEGWAEDDYGFSLAPPTRLFSRVASRSVSRTRANMGMGESWEVD